VFWLGKNVGRGRRADVYAAYEQRSEGIAQAVAVHHIRNPAVSGPGSLHALRREVELGGAPVELMLAGLGDRATLTARPLDAPPPRARLVLLRSGEVQASLAFESRGVTMPALEPGQYLLRLEIPGAQPAELPLRLEG